MHSSRQTGFMPHHAPLASVQKASRKNDCVRSRLLQRGQGMTEYIIVVALVAVAAIAVYQFFGQVIRSQTAAIAMELAGEDGTEQSRAAQTAAESAAAQTATRTLKSFTGNAGAQ